MKKSTPVTVTIDKDVLTKVQKICQSHVRKKSDTINLLLMIGLKEFEKGNMTV